MLSEELSSRLLVQGQEAPREHYDTAVLGFTYGAEDISVSLIPIAEAAEGRLLVGVPKEAWAKAVADRLLPRAALQKAIQIDVAAADSEEPGVALDGEALILWVGLLEKRLVSKLDFASTVAPTVDVVHVLDGGTKLLPHGPSLAEVAEDHFAFLSAASATESQVALEQRMSKLEGSLSEMSAMLRRSLGEPVAPAVGASAKAAPQPRPSALKKKETEKPVHRARFEGLDQTVVASALKAGVPEDQLDVLAGLLHKKNRMEDVGRPAPLKKRSNVLSESEDEEEEELVEEEAPDSQQGQVENALVKLTQIVSSLTKGKKQKGSLDEAMDVAEGGESSSSTTSSRSKAAAYKKLKASLQESPELLSASIEEAMEEDFLQVRLGPGSKGKEMSTRAWVEHRSRLQNYPSSIRFMWILSGIHDAMRQKQWEVAKARTLLAIAAMDQVALDSGNWQLGQEILLEAPAPFASFVNRRLPDPSEQTSSHLLDDRWASVLMWRIRDRDAFQEARRRLSNPRQNPAPKADPAVKGGKGKDGKGKERDSRAPQTEQGGAN